jgi:hypothetical protein
MSKPLFYLGLTNNLLSRPKPPPGGRTLLAGPWVGEFGWELFCWQAYVRKLSRRFDRTIVIGRPGNGFLYADFCDQYIEFDPGSFRTDIWKCHGARSARHIVEATPHSYYLDGQFDIGMRYGEQGLVDRKGLFFREQEFHKYTSDKSSKSFDLLFHCRNKATDSRRNWDRARWDELFRLLGDRYSIGCIGNEEALHIEGAEDLRGVDIEELVAIMTRSRLIVGPSSGPMHLASLCGLKHLVWSSEHNRSRYEKDWNPFGTQVVFYSEGKWHPQPDRIRDLISEQLAGLSQAIG